MRDSWCVIWRYNLSYTETSKYDYKWAQLTLNNGFKALLSGLAV